VLVIDFMQLPLGMSNDQLADHVLDRQRGNMRA
jgi:hypothetical protein